MKISYRCTEAYANWSYRFEVGDIIEVLLDETPSYNDSVRIQIPGHPTTNGLDTYYLRRLFEPLQPVEPLICAVCGEEIKVSELEIVITRDKFLAVHRECAEDEMRRCTHCGYYEWANYFDDYNELCSYCYDNTAVCEDCGERVDVDYMRYSERADGWFCYDCFPRNDSPLPRIHYYDYKPDPEFYGYDETGRYFGVELEVEHERNTSYTVEFLDDFCQLYLKEDGSLNNGFEVVTHPMSMDYMMKFQWKEIVDGLRKAGYHSHNPGSCGLHIHVSREAFSPDGSQDEDMGIGRLLFFITKFESELIRLSRRRSGQLESWARFEHFDSQDDEDACQKAKDMKFNCGRYRAINLQNDETIEFRFWRGTTKYNTLMATFQLTNAMVEIAVTESIKDIDAKDWNYFVENYFNTTEIKQYMEERGMM